MTEEQIEEKALEAAAKAMREVEKGDRKVMPWSLMPSGYQREYIEMARAALRAHATYREWYQKHYGEGSARAAYARRAYKPRHLDRNYDMARRRLAEGMSLAEVAMIYGFSRARVSQVVMAFMRANDLPRGQPREFYEAWFNRRLADQLRAAGTAYDGKQRRPEASA